MDEWRGGGGVVGWGGGGWGFFFNDTATTEIYTLSLHDALPICHCEMGLEDLTRGIFEHRKLESNNLLAGLSEIVAHVEVLEDLGDVEVIDGVRIVSTGQRNHLEFINGLVG